MKWIYALGVCALAAGSQGASNAAEDRPALEGKVVTLPAVGGPAATYGPFEPSRTAATPPDWIPSTPHREGEEERFELPRSLEPRPARVLSGPDGATGGPKAVLADTPAPTFQFSTNADLRGGFPADANLAVSRTHVCLTARAALSCYTKGGLQVPIHASTTGVVSGNTFFDPVRNGGEIFDLRAMFDHFRQRIWIIGLAAAPSNRVTIAVSRTDDPTRGWFLYATNGFDLRAPNNGIAQSVDYPRIGIDQKVMYVGNFVSSQRDCNGDGRTDPNEFCFAYYLVSLRDANQMAAGSGSVPGWVFWDLTTPDGNLAGPAPAVHHTATTRGYLVSNFGQDRFSIFSVNNPLTPSQTVSRVEVSVGALTNPAFTGPQSGTTARVKFDNVGNMPLLVHQRGDRLVWTANDLVDWEGLGGRASVRVVRVNTANFANGSVALEVDRSFGSRSGSDPAGEFFDYGWAAASINHNNDMAIVYARSGASIFPQVRASAWTATDTDIRPSTLVRAGVAPLVMGGGDAWYDTAGASADPFDNVGLYFTQQFPGASGDSQYRLVVAKMFAGTRPDLAPDRISASASSVSRGGTVSVTVRALNQGDGTMPSSSTRWFLSTNDVISSADRLLLSSSLGSVSRSSRLSQTRTLTIPSNVTPGNYFLGVCLDGSSAVTEYHESNNCNTPARSVAPVAIRVN